MSLEKNEFEKLGSNSRNISAQILQVLETNTTLAFSTDDLMKQLNLSRNKVNSALRRLTEKGIINKRYIGKSVYVSLKEVSNDD